MDINKFAAAQLSEARYLSGLTLDALAEKTKLSKSALSRILSGEQKKIALADYLAILSACNVRQRTYLNALSTQFKRSKK